MSLVYSNKQIHTDLIYKLIINLKNNKWIFFVATIIKMIIKTHTKKQYNWNKCKQHNGSPFIATRILFDISSKSGHWSGCYQTLIPHLTSLNDALDNVWTRNECTVAMSLLVWPEAS